MQKGRRKQEIVFLLNSFNDSLYYNILNGRYIISPVVNSECGFLEAGRTVQKAMRIRLSPSSQWTLPLPQEGSVQKEESRTCIYTAVILHRFAGGRVTGECTKVDVHPGLSSVSFQNHGQCSFSPFLSVYCLSEPMRGAGDTQAIKIWAPPSQNL